MTCFEVKNEVLNVKILTVALKTLSQKQVVGTLSSKISIGNFLLGKESYRH
jgi:hypothetical protein